MYVTRTLPHTLPPSFFSHTHALGHTYISYAARKVNYDMVAHLLRMDADEFQKDSSGVSVGVVHAQHCPPVRFGSHCPPSLLFTAQDARCS